MKSPLRKLAIAAFAAGLVSSAAAAPPGKGLFGTKTYMQAATQEQIQSLKKGHRYAMVCMECKSITVKEVADDKEVEALCHDGGSVHCDSCKMKFTIKHVGPPGKGAATTKVTILNEQGKECMFIAPVTE